MSKRFNNSSFFLPLVAFLLIFTSCANSQQSSKTKSARTISVSEFNSMISKTDHPQIIDVRTPGEYKSGHLASSKNINWNSNSFKTQVVELDTSKPVFVYCLSGGRSSSAANFLASKGFTVYNMQGGMMRWKGSNLPVSQGENPKPKGMSKTKYDSLISSNQTVVINFYAEWCAPCKKMTPYIENMQKESDDSISIIRIDADEHEALTNLLGIQAIPVVQVFKNGLLAWEKKGFVAEEELKEHL